MVKNHSPASAITDSCWYKLCQFTIYKAERRGGRGCSSSVQRGRRRNALYAESWFRKTCPGEFINAIDVDLSWIEM